MVFNLARRRWQLMKPSPNKGNAWPGKGPHIAPHPTPQKKKENITLQHPHTIFLWHPSSKCFVLYPLCRSPPPPHTPTLHIPPSLIFVSVGMWVTTPTPTYRHPPGHTTMNNCGRRISPSHALPNMPQTG